MRVLFVCGRNRWRSPTAERVFEEIEGWEVMSAGLNRDAEVPLTAELVRWADTIAVMEKAQRRRLLRRFGQYVKGQRVVCLEIPDRYTYMDPELVALLRVRARRIV